MFPCQNNRCCFKFDFTLKQFRNIYSLVEKHTSFPTLQNSQYMSKHTPSTKLKTTRKNNILFLFSTSTKPNKKKIHSKVKSFSNDASKYYFFFHFELYQTQTTFSYCCCLTKFSKNQIQSKQNNDNQNIHKTHNRN